MKTTFIGFTWYLSVLTYDFRFLTSVTEKWRKRRLGDFKQGWEDLEETYAETQEKIELDDELREKLRQNEKQKKTVQSVIDVRFYFLMY